MRKKRLRYWSRDRPRMRDNKQRRPKQPDPTNKSKLKLMEVPIMKHLKRIFALCLVLALSLMIIPAAFAACYFHDIIKEPLNQAAAAD